MLLAGRNSGLSRTTSEEAKGDIQVTTGNNRKFTILLVALLGLMLLHGAVESLGVGQIVAELLTLAVNVAGIYAVCRSRRQYLIGTSLAALSVAATLTNVATGMSVSVWIALDFATLAALMAYLGALILFEIFSGGRITQDSILGSICTYLLLAIFWSSVYGALQTFVPNAYAVGGQATTLAEHELVYFSFVTLSTLGYGDVTPIAAIAQDLAVMEAVSGQFYLATLVAVLVSLGMASRERG